MDIDSCQNCIFCIFFDDDDSTGISPGGLLMTDKYKCDNRDSVACGNVMTVITNLNTNETIDGRDNSYCDKHRKDETNE